MTLLLLIVLIDDVDMDAGWRLEGMNPDAVVEWRLEGTSMLDGGWKGWKFEGMSMLDGDCKGCRCWMGIGRNVNAGWGSEGTEIGRDRDWKGR